jgi:hypothetical protein
VINKQQVKIEIGKRKDKMVAAALTVTVAAPLAVAGGLAAVGFGAAGVGAGTLAAGLQAGIGNVVAGSLFAGSTFLTCS